MLLVVSAFVVNETAVMRPFAQAAGAAGALGTVASRPPMITAVVRLRKTRPVTKASKMAIKGGSMLYQGPISESPRTVGA